MSRESRIRRLGTAPVSRAGAEPQDLQVYGHIFDAILEQRLAPGTKLTEDALGQIFGVSRTIIRKALSRLTHEQVVQFHPNRGSYIAEPNLNQAREILDARRLVELAIVDRVAKRSREIGMDLEPLRKMIDAENRSIVRQDIGSAIRLSGEFHLALAELSASDPLSSFLRSLVPQTSLIISLYQVSDGSRCSIDEHGQLLDALEAGDVEQSVKLMGEHLDHIESRIDFGQRKSGSVGLSNLRTSG